MSKIVEYPAAIDTSETLDLRVTAHSLGLHSRIALLLYAAELALITLPIVNEIEITRFALELASRVAAGEPVDPDDIAEAMHDEDDEGPVYYEQVAPRGPQARAWAAVSSSLGYAAFQESVRQDVQPPALISGFNSPDSLDFSVDMFVGIPALDWSSLARATAWARKHASKAEEGWGEPLRVEKLRQAASPPRLL